MFNRIKGFLINSIKAHIAKGIKTDVCFCLGSGKNFKIINKLNQEHGFFNKLIPLEHPRYIMQYKSKHKQEYIEKYIEALKGF